MSLIKDKSDSLDIGIGALPRPGDAFRRTASEQPEESRSQDQIGNGRRDQAADDDAGDRIQHLTAGLPRREDERDEGDAAGETDAFLESDGLTASRAGAASSCRGWTHQLPL